MARCIGQIHEYVQQLLTTEQMASSMAKSTTARIVQPFVRGSSLKMQIADAIRTQILAGRYALGAKLDEKTLQREFDVSRTPVREALLSLQTEGLIVIKPQSGTFVFKPTAEDVHHLCQLRSILEVEAIRMAIERRHVELGSELQQIVKEATRMLTNGRLEECHLLDTGFHRTFVESCGNPLLVDAYKAVSDRVHALRQVMPLTKSRIAAGFAGHREIVKAVKKGDANLATDLIRSHITRVEELLLRRF